MLSDSVRVPITAVHIFTGLCFMSLVFYFSTVRQLWTDTCFRAHNELTSEQFLDRPAAHHSLWRSAC